MNNRLILIVASLCLLSVLSASAERSAVKLASLPALSPDGKTLVFEYRRDLWKASSAGGRATRLTRHPAFDTRPIYSPEGKELAFQSNREDSWQTYIMPSAGGAPRQVTYHSEGSTPLDWFPDGSELLVRGDRDFKGFIQTRFFKVPAEKRENEELIFDAACRDADLSPDGTRILFTRYGSKLYRKGYNGSAASQIWLYNMQDQSFTKVCDDSAGCRSPLWNEDGTGFYFVCQRDGCFNVWEHDLATGAERQLTDFEDASVIIPAISGDGSKMVFRQLFDFYSMDPRDPETLKKLDIWIDVDDPPQKSRRRVFDKVWNNDEYGSVDFSTDALEICFTAGGDLWVMDTILREPKRICGDSGTHEREAIFGPNDDEIYFLRDNGLGVNIWKAKLQDESKYWWQNEEFDLTPVTDDRRSRTNLEISPDGQRISFVQNHFELWTYNLDMTSGRKLCESPFDIHYEWAPDGNWLVASVKDSWGNSDVWILSENNEAEPFNLSRHPNWDSNARWSPDGKKIAFTGKRYDDEIDLFYVYLRKEDEARSERDQRLAQALRNMQKKRGKAEHKPEEENVPPEPKPKEEMADKSQSATDQPSENGEESEPKANAEAETVSSQKREEDSSKDLVEIDFDGLADRIHRISIPNATPSHPFWSYDSRALAFQATIRGKRGTYKVVFPDKLQPHFMNAATGIHAEWIKDGSRILWLSNGQPAVYTKKYGFKAFYETNIPKYKRLAFRLIWRNLRDGFYDPALNHLDWEKMRLKYEDMATQSDSWDVFDRVVSMLLGELNASHLDFSRSGKAGEAWRDDYSSGQWKTRTAHLGLRFDREWDGPGLKIESVIPGGPCDQVEVPIRPGDIVTHIENQAIGPLYDLTQILNGRYERILSLRIENEKGDVREVEVESMGYEEVRDLVREEWIRQTENEVENLSQGKLGYLNIQAMQTSSLRRFEREVYDCGFGKDGLVIDVRNNPGGFTADQLLSILCHPRHALTVPRNGSVSYQQSYLNQATWTKPIIVLCNQYSGSNAEIFCHAIKTLERGKLVGVPTKGAVISTPRKRILDVGKMTLPNRGWFLLNDQDMEVAPCVPDVIVPAFPGDIPAGDDKQLQKAVEILTQDTLSIKEPSDPVYASEIRAMKANRDDE